MWNIAAPFVCQFFWEKVQAVLPYVDVVFGNETEAVAFGKAAGWGVSFKYFLKSICFPPLCFVCCVSCVSVPVRNETEAVELGKAAGWGEF